MKYRKKGLHAEPKSDVEKEIRKSQEKIFDNFEEMKTYSQYTLCLGMS